jgi:hypothetical protein
MTVQAVLGLTTPQILGLSVLAALVTTIGNLVATWLREYMFVRSFERWRDRRTLLSVFRKYRDPLLLASNELRGRIDEICKLYPPGYLARSVLDQRPSELEANSADDPYFQRYKLISSVFRLCAFLGWLELYRQELTFFDTGQRTINEQLERSLEMIRSQLGDGQLNTAPDWREWSDRLIFRDEQRAIGESMIVADTPRVVMGYASFHALFDQADGDDALWWLRTARGFFLDPVEERDFRRQRLEAIRDGLDKTMALLDPERAQRDRPVPRY